MSRAMLCARRPAARAGKRLLDRPLPASCPARRRLAQHRTHRRPREGASIDDRAPSAVLPPACSASPASCTSCSRPSTSTRRPTSASSSSSAGSPPSRSRRASGHRRPARLGTRRRVAAGMAVGFVLSRSVGLPGFHEPTGSCRARVAAHRARLPGGRRSRIARARVAAASGVSGHDRQDPHQDRRRASPRSSSPASPPRASPSATTSAAAAAATAAAPAAAHRRRDARRRPAPRRRTIERNEDEGAGEEREDDE